MNEMDDQDCKSVASDFSILPEASEVEAMSLAQPFLAADFSKSSASGSYNQVEFVNMCSNYPATQELALYYRFVANHTPVVTDRLALYRVGFTSPQHYLVYEWAPREALAAPPIHLLKEGELQAPIYAITFRKAILPRDAAEFYQVCYVSEEQSIRGVSSPFQLVQDGEGACSITGGFIGASNDVFSAIEQPDGSILVTSDLTTLHANIKMLQETVQQVREEKAFAEKKLTTIQTQLHGKQEQLAHLEHTISELRAQADEERASSAEAVAAVVTKLQQAEQERNGLQEMLHQAREEVCRLQEETLRQQKKEDQLAERLLEREQRLADYSSEAEVQKQCLEVATNQLQALAQKQELLESELQQCVIQRDEARQQVQFWTEAASADKSVVHQLQDQCHTANEELQRQLDALQAEQERAGRAEDQTKATIADLDGERAALLGLQQSLKACQQELQVSDERRKVLDADNRSLQHSLRSLQTAADELQEQLRESCSAREGAERVAEQLSSRQQDVERQRAALEAKNKTLVSKCSKLSKLILDQNVTESVEALIGLHDGDSTSGDDDDGDCIVAARTTSFGGAATVTTATSSLAALELSGSVDSRMNTMLEELLGHVRQLKSMMNARTDAAGQDVATADSDLGKEDGTADGLTLSVVQVPGEDSESGGGGAVIVVEVTTEEDDTENEGDISVVEVTGEEVGTENGGAVNVVEITSEVERCERERKVDEALAAAQSAMEALMDHARLQREVEEEKVEANPTVVAEANAEAVADEVLQEQVGEAEMFVDAPTRPSSTVINMESIPPERTVEQQVLQQQLSQPNVDPQPDLTMQPQESATKPTPDELIAQQQQQPAPQHRPDPSCYYGPVFTSGQTAPVFFPQRSTNAGASASGHSSFDSNSAGVGGHAFPPFTPPPFATPIALPYPPMYPMPLPAAGFHPYPPPCSFHPMPPPPPGSFHPMPPSPPVAPQAGTGLPPPLLPEKTEGARHAALLSTISAVAAQAIHNITSGLTPPAAESAPSSGASFEAGGAAHVASAATTADGSSCDDGGSTTCSSDTGFTSYGHSGEAGSNNAGSFHYNRDRMRWQYGGDGLNSSWGMGFAGNGEARAEVRHGYGGGYCHRFGNSTTEQQNTGHDQQRNSPGMCTDFIGRMNQVRDQYQQTRQMQHQACQMAQQAAQQQRMHMRVHRSQLREQCIRQREEQRNRVRRDATTGAVTVTNAAFAVSDAATAVTNASAAASNVAVAAVSVSDTAASAFAAAVDATVATPAVNDVTAAAPAVGADQSQQLYEEDVEGDASQQRAAEDTQPQSSQETASARRSQEADDGYLHCPMCQLKFGKTSSGLFEEHINSHLEFICPVCNTAFQRSQENEFTAHVETHFDDEDYTMPSAPSQEDTDPSGPWARSISHAVRRFIETD